MCFRPPSAKKGQNVCPNPTCGKENEPGAKYCAFCGEELSTPTTPPRPGTVPPPPAARPPQPPIQPPKPPAAGPKEPSSPDAAPPTPPKEN